LSGVGAATDGGRFNRSGVEALYLSRAAPTAFEEYRQGASIAPPATLTGYKVTLDSVVDLSSGYEAALWSPEWADWGCNWRKIARIDKDIPPSWLLSDAVIEAGHRGILFPSLQHPGGTNLVIFNANLTTSDKLEVHDPDGRLPLDQSSWS